MMDGVNISKLGLLLTCLFSLFFLALLAEILFLLLSHRRHSATASSDNDNDQPSSSAKRIDFIHSFLKRQSAGRVEPSGATAARRVSASREPPALSSLPAEELMKMEYYSRLLFTIQEEEREGIECYSSERSPVLEDPRRQRKLNPDEVKVSAAGGESSTEIVRAQAADVTPFETPCASPLDYYYTPSASPHG